ncbi:MAG: TIGR02221 family CRISPR-associated protein, partial [Microscillaceae bacterium]|nr:TIGR02221 family CRISPR-associated protein [Microscillaceae bacterium]MDW8461154.1 TIGR02221 family CRISPR-associated protein [Cytophagales bacterium]
MIKKTIFISTLGTGNYDSTTYTYQNQSAQPTKFVQKAILELVSKVNNVKIDEVLIFTTSKAKEKHYTALVQEFESLNISPEPVDIIEAQNTAEIWNIFTTIYQNIPENSQLIIDITHAFRYMPMLLVILLPYSKMLKNIEVIGIYYGEFEKSRENNPIIDITSFHTLQEWTLATYDFIKNGNAKYLASLAHLAQTQIKPMLAETKDKDANASITRSIAKKLKEFTEYIEVCRSKKLIEGNFADVAHQIESISQDFIPAFTPLFDEIKGVMSNYKKNTLENQLHAVEYCIHKGKIQQAATFLHEYVTSFVAKSIGENYEDKDIRKDIREVISGYLSFTGQGKERQKWSYKLKDKPKEDELLDKIDRIPNSKEIAKVSSSLSNLRNDLNHAGYTKTPSSYDKMLKNLTSYYSKITQKLAEIPTIESTSEIKPVQERFLLNFTNHKFEGWTDKQKEAAIRQFG